MNWVSRKKARNRLEVPESVLDALIRSGLLGYTLSDMVSDRALLSYARFGTQWEIDQRYGPTIRMMPTETYNDLPLVEGIGPQPPATRAHGYIYPPNEQNPQGLERSDTGWIAHFYLVPNYFYFPDPTELALVGQPPLKLSEPRPISGAGLPVTLYPHPSGCVGLVAVEGLERSVESVHEEAYNVAMPLLDELSARYDVPLPVAHMMAVGVPSGIIHHFFAQHSQVRQIESEAEILPWCPHPELRDAYALYREAVSSNNPFHAFLTFWKVYEEAVYVRRGWGAKHKRSDTRIREEVFPDLFAFGSRAEELADPSEHPGERPEEQLRGEKFKKARKVLNGPYRVALAHAGEVDAGKPLTAASYEDYQKVASKVSVVRYMANVVLGNVRATFDAEVGREQGEA